MKADDIFQAALEQATPAQRTAYLDAVCAHDPELRARVEELLQSHEQAGSFLQQPLFGNLAAVSQSSTESAATVIGPYKLIEQIGEGGMGTVWMAQQSEPVRRTVALKLIKAGMDSRQVITRFEAERQALALMDHPNIAKVLDAGTTENGRPYFVMELVKGAPITSYCDEHHLTPKERLELFVPVCQAIQHAHQKGIIHRDLKPSNVLVSLYDGRPVPKVIDFGVAKAVGQPLTEKTLVTGFGNLVGTLEYMSPEQAQVNQFDIDTRSDIYSLGVLLYELLTGSTPFSRDTLQQAGMLEMLRVIREQEPSKPSTKLSTAEGLPTLAANRGTEPAKLTKLVRGELDWIVMKALEKDRDRRYETANGFAADVHRYLADEPVEACPPSAAYRLRKFARRNQARLTTAGLALLFVMLLAGVVGWVVWDRAAIERENAQEEARKLTLTALGIRHALDRAEASRAELHALLTKRGGVQEMLNQPSRWELFIKTAQGELAHARQLEVRAEGSLDPELTLAMNDLDLQLSSDQTDFDLAKKLERIRSDVANWRDGAFDYRMAIAEYPKAVSCFRVLSDDPASVAAKIASSPIRDQLVAALDDWASNALAMQQDDVAEQVLEVARRAAPESDWGNRVRQLSVCRDREFLDNLIAEAPVDGLSPHLCSLIGALAGQAGATRHLSWLRRAQAVHPGDYWLNYSLARSLSESDPVEAAGYYRVAIAVRPANNAAYNNLGVLLQRQLKWPEATACFQQAIKVDPNFAYGYSNLCFSLRELGRLDEALTFGRKALLLDPKDTNTYNHLGNALAAQGKSDEAIACYQEALEIDPRCANAHHNMGVSIAERGELEQAIAFYHSALQIDPKHAKAHNSLGNAFCLQGKLDDAIKCYRTAIEIMPNLASAHFNLGLALRKQGNADDAVASYCNSIELNPNYVDAHYALGNAFRDLGKPDEAVASYRKAIELAPNYLHAHHALGNVFLEEGEFSEAIGCYEKTIELDPNYTNGFTGLERAFTSLGDAHRNQGKIDKAIDAYYMALKATEHIANQSRDLARIQRDLHGLLVSAGREQDAEQLFHQVRTRCEDYAENNRMYSRWELAWFLVTWPDSRFHDAPMAIELAERLVKEDPEVGYYWRTLGAAHLRGNDPSAAISALEKANEFAEGGSPWEWYFLAMAHWQRGNKEDALKWFDRANESLEKLRGHTDFDEILQFQTEASNLLGGQDVK